MRILIFTHAISRHKDDYPQFINELALAYQQAGHDVMLLTASHATIETELLDRQLNIVLYRYAPKKLEVLGYGKSMRSDLNMTLGSIILSPLMFISGFFALRRNIKTFRPDFIHSHWVIPSGVIASLAFTPGRIKHIVSCPGSDVTAMGSNILLEALGRYACKHASVLTTNSHDLRNELWKLGVTNNRFAYVIYGTRSDRGQKDSGYIKQFKENHLVSADETILLAVGRLVPKKGFRYLIEALKYIDSGKKYRLVIVGDGLDREPLFNLARKHGVDKRIVFTGNIAYTQLPQFYMMADIFVMPAVRNPADGLNVVVTEAMKYALPIVATSVGGNELVIDHGINGLLCAEKNPMDLAICINRFLDDGELMQACSANSGKLFYERASWEEIANRYIDLIKSTRDG